VTSKRKAERKQKRWAEHLARLSQGPLCPYCHDTGKAPGSDDRTPCGFCGEAS
jgi:hypothetical protein